MSLAQGTSVKSQENQDKLEKLQQPLKSSQEWLVYTSEQKNKELQTRHGLFFM